MHRVDADALGREPHRQRLAQVAHARLRGVVGRVPAGAADEAVDRGDVDDRTAARVRAAHRLRAVLAAEEDAGRVDRHDPLPALGAVRVGLRAAAQPGVVDQRVEPAVPLQRRRDQRLPIRLRAHVGMHVQRLAAVRADLGRDLLAELVRDVGQDHARALAGEQPRLGRAHPRRGPRDDGGLALEASHRGPLSRARPLATRRCRSPTRAAAAGGRCAPPCRAAPCAARPRRGPSAPP